MGTNFTNNGTLRWESDQSAGFVSSTFNNGGLFDLRSNALRPLGWTSADAAYKARVGLNAVSVDAPEWPVWQNTQAWISALSRPCSQKEFRLYCLEI